MNNGYILHILSNIDQAAPNKAFNLKLLDTIEKNEEQRNEIHRDIIQLSTYDPQFALSAAKGFEQVLLKKNSPQAALGKTAWLVGWAANECTRLDIATPALDRATTIFHNLNSQGWLAACLWQQNTPTWTKLNFVEAASKLASALNGLITHEMSPYIPQCRLSLINAYLLIQNLEAAIEQIGISKKSLTNPLNIARLNTLEGILLRRQHRFNEAEKLFHQVIDQFKTLNAPVDTAQIYYQLGLILFISAKDYPKATTHLEKAVEIFKKHDIILWETACQNTLGQLHMLQGFPKKAAMLYSKARETLENQQVKGMLADNLNDTGQLTLQGGDLSLAISHFKKAKNIYHQLGLKQNELISAANLGDAYRRSGKYQEALEILESTLDQLKIIHNPFRSASVHYYLSQLWKALNNFNKALEHLQKAEELHALANQEGMVTWMRLHQSEIQIINTNYPLALDQLASIEAKNPERPLLGLVKRYQSLIALRQNNLSEAANLNQKAAEIFDASNMMFELAECMLILAQINQKQEKLNLAKEYYEKATSINQNIMPDIHWRSQVGLGEIAQKTDCLETAYQYYWTAFKTLTQTRQSLWQPSLSAGLMSGRQKFLSQIIHISNEIGMLEETFALIEGSKSILFKQKLQKEPPIGNKYIDELNQLRQEITYLQHQMRLSMGSNLWQRGKAETISIQNRLKDLTKQYTSLSEKHERQSTRLSSITPELSIDTFRQTANTTYPNGWIALDYHIDDNDLTIIALTPSTSERFKLNISPITSLSLNACIKNTPNKNDLSTLGKFLIPLTIENMLSPDIPLIISPHKDLHYVPWSTLLLEQSQCFLVEKCAPIITPSLQTTFELITNLSTSPNKNGLVIGISEHPQYPNLPNVELEIATLQKKLSPNSKVLLNIEANWKLIIQTTKQQNFGFLHLATHIQADTRSGKLSRIILNDQNIWVDQLSELAPLPPLVTLSACNGLYSYVLPGDELIGFSTACLNKGAKTIIGSQWPILDIHANQIMNIFYDNYLNGKSASLSLAYAIRSALEQNISPLDLNGLICFGAG